MAKTLAKTLAERFRIEPGKRVELGKRDPADASAFPDRGEAEVQSKADARAINALAGQAVRGRQAGAAGGAAGHRYGRQGRHHPPRLQRDRAARRHRHVVPPAERGGAGARLPVARAPRLPAPRLHRHLQPLALRGRAGGPRAQAGAGGGDRARYEQINAFEQMLTENGTTILKFMLHISKKEQGERLQARLDEPKSRWKFDPHDLDDRKLWDEYQAAYEMMLDRCSTALGALARHPRRPQMGAQRCHRRHRARDPGGDGPAVPQARVGPQGFQGGLRARAPLSMRPPVCRDRPRCPPPPTSPPSTPA